MDRNNIDKITDNSEERILLAKMWDKIHAGFQKNILAHTGFLSPRQLQLAQYLFGNQCGLITFGGFPGAERKMYIYLPDYLTEDFLHDNNAPIVCLRASFFKTESLTHRDVLGALMGCGISRESIGDILISDNHFDFFTTSEIAPFLLQNFNQAGRVNLKVTQIPIHSVSIPAQKYEEVSATVASVRLDSIISSGFGIGRTTAAEYITGGRVSVDGIYCEKPDKTIAQNSKITVRGMGKIHLFQIGHTTKKGRISVIIHRFL